MREKEKEKKYWYTVSQLLSGVVTLTGRAREEGRKNPITRLTLTAGAITAQSIGKRQEQTRTCN